MQVIGVCVGVIVAHPVTVAVTMPVAVVMMRVIVGMPVMMIMRMVVMTVSHSPYSTSGPAGMETGLSMMDL